MDLMPETHTSMHAVKHNSLGCGFVADLLDIGAVQSTAQVLHLCRTPVRSCPCRLIEKKRLDNVGL